MDRLGMVRRETLTLEDGGELCLHAISRETWSARR